MQLFRDSLNGYIHAEKIAKCSELVIKKKNLMLQTGGALVIEKRFLGF
jgi:hypothetical protein